MKKKKRKKKRKKEKEKKVTLNLIKCNRKSEKKKAAF
jgi:hypothetical protein